MNKHFSDLKELLGKDAFVFCFFFIVLFSFCFCIIGTGSSCIDI